MKESKYRQIFNAARIWADLTEKGNRQKEQKIYDMVANEVRKEHRTTMKDAQKDYIAIVIQKSVNRGTRNYPNIFNVTSLVWKEQVVKITDKTIITDHNERIGVQYIQGFITRG